LRRVEEEREREGGLFVGGREDGVFVWTRIFLHNKERRFFESCLSLMRSLGRFGEKGINTNQNADLLFFWLHVLFY
jgi:hypothetical protein